MKNLCYSSYPEHYINNSKINYLVEDLFYTERKRVFPKVQLKTEDGFTTISIELVKADKTKIKIAIEDSLLRIIYDNSKDNRNKYLDYSLKILAKFDISKISSKYEDGELLVTIPHKEKEIKYITIE
jgi:HSP20 family molecular chaperone IbpA